LGFSALGLRASLFDFFWPFAIVFILHVHGWRQPSRFRARMPAFSGGGPAKGALKQARSSASVK